MATRTLSLSCIAEVALVLMRISVEDASTMSTYVDKSELFGIAGDLEDESPLVGTVVYAGPGAVPRRLPVAGVAPVGCQVLPPSSE